MAVLDQKQPQLDYGARVRDLRRQVNWSQLELAKRAGIHNVTLSRLESGVAVPKLETLASIAGAFSLPLEVMLREKPIVLGVKIEKKGDLAEE